VGIVSRGTDNCDLAVYSAVSSWSQWIREVGEHAFDIGDYDRPQWLDAPELTGAESDDTIVAATGDSAAVPAAPLPSGAEAPAASHGSGCSLCYAGASERALPWAFAALLATFGLRGARRKRAR
jgi:hypothetical protein